MKLLFEILFREPSKIIRFKNYLKFLIFVLFYSGKKRYTKTKVTLYGKSIIVPDTLSFVWQFHEIFVEQYYKFNTTNSKPIILDCGANIGLSALYFKMLFPNSDIYAFEPDNNIFECLKNNINSFGLKDVTLIKKAVWIHNEGVKFFSEGADGSSIFSDKADKLVESVSLKEFIVGIDREIDFLKMDIEGAEVEVIKDCDTCLNKIKNLFIEYHAFVNSEQQLDVILKILTKNGFRYFIKPEADRRMPYINRINKNFSNVDLQLNIFAYK